MPKLHKQLLSADEFEKRIGIVFANQSLLVRALTHRSYSTEHMERLEFLGDAVLGLVIADYLHNRFANEDEGQLSRLRAGLVRKESLFEVAKLWRLQDYLQVGEGERSVHGIKANSIVANAVEAVIGAVFKDSGWLAAQDLIMQAWQPLLKNMCISDARDAKSQLQEYTQGKGLGLPTYQVSDLGVGKDPRFEATCRVSEQLFTLGYGARKKNAELNAAEKVLKLLLDLGEVI